MRNSKTTCIAALLSLLASTAIAGDYSELADNEIQIPGHPYKTAADCERTAPIGKFDRRCDIPLLGYRNFSDPTIGIGSAGVGGLGGFGY